MLNLIVSQYNYWIYVVLMMVGFYAMMAKRNLIKKLIGMNIFQSAIILFFISAGVKKGGTIPIVPEHAHEAVIASQFVNPLPHVLMLTAIVVSIATTGVALAILITIYRRYGTLEEDEINEIIGSRR
jgi:multicomponent Na+:H+ antiporter subunit C